jgi:hypothetical protein
VKILIAIDDTDNLQSRGTGFLARKMAERLVAEGLALVWGITRHQLLVHDDIPYTSHNSAACIAAEAVDIEKITYLCRRFLSSECAQGSDAGLCIADEARVSKQVVDWGYSAKRDVLSLPNAVKLAASEKLYLEGFSGTHGGMIGALAAVGLHKAGNDGRFLWVKGMRKYMGVMKCCEIFDETGVDEIRHEEEKIVDKGARCLLPEWWRPLLREHKKILLVEPVDNPYYEYQLITKDRLKRYSS